MLERDRWIEDRQRDKKQMEGQIEEKNRGINRYVKRQRRTPSIY
jgi:hypothetical protein